MKCGKYNFQLSVYYQFPDIKKLWHDAHNEQ